ncbi:MAG: F0F1 ATP synthase subunit B [Phycisphaerae bacterium]|nr:F0F1 ATP synthase subunit B [Phycisphaerae bacterium]
MKRRNWLWQATVALVVLIVVPSLALASEVGGEHGKPSIFQGGVHNLIWTLLIFMTIIVVLGKSAWGPLLAALQRREEFIRESLENAKKEREEAEKLLRQYTEQINKAREEASAICDEGRRDAEAVRRKVESEARAEAEAIVKRAKREIEIAQQHAVKEIYEEMADVATKIASRVLEREISADEHQQLVASSLEEIRQKASSN